MEERYRRFIIAVLTGDEVTATNMTLGGFRVDLDDADLELTLTEYLIEVARQRRAFPNLGRIVSVIRTEETNNQLVIEYLVTARFTGILVSRDGSRRIEGTGKPIVFSSTDTVTFGEHGKIQSINIDTNTRQILAQMFD